MAQTAALPAFVPPWPGVTLRTTLNCRGRLLSLAQPLIMGILNVTPDSFSDGGQHNSPEAALGHARQLLAAGATIIDVGGYSSRPGADDIPEAEELARVLPVITAIAQELPQAFISIDTFRAGVARQALAAGAHIVNDISGGVLEPDIMRVAAQQHAPYILMHMQGRPQTMQQAPGYKDVVQDVWQYFVQRITAAQAAGLYDLVLDPGFGFGKTPAHNFALFGALGHFTQLGYPLLVGISRKSFISKALGKPFKETPFAQEALHALALQAGVKILRVHEPAPTAQVLNMLAALKA